MKFTVTFLDNTKRGPGEIPRPSKEGGVKDRIPDTNALYTLSSSYINIGLIKRPYSPFIEILPQPHTFRHEKYTQAALLFFHNTLHDLDLVGFPVLAA